MKEIAPEPVHNVPPEQREIETTQVAGEYVLPVTVPAPAAIDEESR